MERLFNMRSWESLSGVPISDIVAEVRALHECGPRDIHVGSDAKHRGMHTDFVTAIVVLNPGLGGRVFFRRERTQRSRSLAEQLFREVELSLKAAQFLAGELGLRSTVHVDANVDVRHDSSTYVQSLAGMVMGYGFPVQVKPNAWCATHVADFVVKEKHCRAA